MYEVNKKKYIDVRLPSDILERVQRIHKQSEKDLRANHIQNPLERNVLKVKVPYARNRVTCRVQGVKTIQELVAGDAVKVTLDWCGVWEVGDYCGMAWKLSLIETPNLGEPPSS